MFSAVQSPVQNVGRVVRAEDYNAVSDNRYTVTVAGVLRVAPSISEVRVTGDGFRTTEIEVRPVKASNNEWCCLAVASWGVRGTARTIAGKDIAVRSRSCQIWNDEHQREEQGVSSGMGIIAGVLRNYAASLWDIRIHPLRLANWVALKGYQVTDARLSYCMIYASRPKKNLSVEQQNGRVVPRTTLLVSTRHKSSLSALPCWSDIDRSPLWSFV